MKKAIVMLLAAVLGLGAVPTWTAAQDKPAAEEKEKKHRPTKAERRAERRAEREERREAKRQAREERREKQREQRENRNKGDEK